MVCPKCGRDCGSDLYCEPCREQIKPLVKYGERLIQRNTMVCPCCGAREAIGNVCAYCDSPLPQEIYRATADEGINEVPVGTCDRQVNSFTLRKSEIVIEVNRKEGKRVVTRIPFHMLSSVLYIRPNTKRDNSVGYMVFRWEGNKDVPLPELTVEGLEKDNTTLRTVHDCDTIFFHLYCYLWTKKPDAVFRLFAPNANKAGLEEFAQTVGTDAYYERFTPFRTLAALRMAQEHGIPYNKARNILDRTFDARLLQAYAECPSLAARDMIRVMERYCSE